MVAWLRGVLASATMQLVAKLLITIVPLAAIWTTLESSWTYAIGAPVAFKVLLAVAVAILVLWVVLALVTFLAQPPSLGIQTPRWLRWHRLPIHRIAWDFDNVLGWSSSTGSPVKIEAIQAKFRINWGDGIRPKRAFIECPSTGARKDVLLSPGNPYVKAESIEFIPRRKGWINCQVHWGGISKEAFLAEYSGLRFVFEYDETRQEINFPRELLETILERAWRYNNKAPEGGAVIMK